ncbi:hypothetical protein EJD97_022626 [Solanum chilense]|uniref:Uncharacterized protein n=1 Tax=Solanum chilense TaxID=4083 RepID=A0A6N2AXD5_SOLCI|nr:hypothetical protein EJD97_022626 [Solanum chilense]
MYKDSGRRWGAMTINMSESYNGLLKKARGLSVTVMVRMTFKSLVDHFVEKNNLTIAFFQSNMSWPLAMDKFFNDYYQRAQGHTDMMTYNTGDIVFEILTFAHDSKGGNVHKVTAKVGDEMYWPPAPFNLIANTESLRTSGTQVTSRLKNDMDIAPARMTRKYSVCNETGHTKTRCPTRF